VIEFVTIDTNVLIYSIDLRDLQKHNLCRKIVRRCGQIGGVISLQCLTEFSSHSEPGGFPVVFVLLSKRRRQHPLLVACPIDLHRR
jgi:hypothetical protein